MLGYTIALLLGVAFVAASFIVVMDFHGEVRRLRNELRDASDLARVAQAERDHLRELLDRVHRISMIYEESREEGVS